MLNVALVALLTALQPSTSAQAELTGQACTARDIVGTWQLTTKSSIPGVASVVKYITPTHFFVTRVGANDVVLSGHGGPYTLAGGTYTETLAQGFGAPIEQLEKYRGVSVAFQCRLNGDVLHIVGELSGTKIDEQWKRVSGTSAPR